MSDRKRIIYVHKGASSFVKNDQRILEAVFDVRVIAFLPKSKWKVPFLLVRMLFSLLREVPRADAVVCQFAGHHALLPIVIARLFGKRGIVISNGSDCVGFPSLNYGHFRKRLLGWSTRTCFRLCDRIIPLDASLVHHVPTYHDIDPSAQGDPAFLPGPEDTHHRIGLRFRPRAMESEGRATAEAIHHGGLRCASAIGAGAQRPGYDPASRSSVPGCGVRHRRCTEGSFPVKPANVKEIPFVPHDRITTWYGSATYYLQLSVSEGFGNALCEAMLCGCIPIVSNTGAMPSIVGGTGYIVPRRDVDVLEGTIRDAMLRVAPLGPEAMRERIVHYYPVALRATGLPDIVTEAIDRP